MSIIEDFFSVYLYLKRPSEIPTDNKLMFFKGDPIIILEKIIKSLYKDNNLLFGFNKRIFTCLKVRHYS